MKAQDFVASASALGATRMRILVRHILPNVVTPVVVAATLGIGHVIVLEAGLSCLGIGVRQPTPSWGNMIQDGSDQIVRRSLVDLFFPGDGDRADGDGFQRSWRCASESASAKTIGD